MAFVLRAQVVRYLSLHPGEKFTARQIAQWIFENFPAECQEKKARSASIKTDAKLLQQIVAEISPRHLQAVRRRNPQLKITEERPIRYYWEDKEDQDAGETDQDSITAEEAGVDLSQKGKRLQESDLYPLLSEYLWSELRVYPKRIDERKSSNKQGPRGNKWLYPDLVGMEDITAGWHQEIKGLVKEYADKKTKLWSFEAKLRLNRSNVREAFFQAVSNSSWANFGYLVAVDIEGTDTMNELRMLFSLHGIGLIQIDPQSPAKSRIVIPTRERVEVDWATCNRLTRENKDFLQFLKLVRQFHQTGDPRPKDWDFSDDH